MSEHDLQKQIVMLLKRVGILTIETDVMSGLQFLPVNTAARFRFVAHHKSMGYVSGQPDLILLLRDGETLLVELKNGKAGKQSLDQKLFQERCNRLSHNYVVWRSYKDALDFIDGYRKI